MINIDAIAQRFPQNEGRPLVDYFPVLLPCQVLIVDALVIERHPIPTPVEFAMKTITAGITCIGELGSFLGFSEKYTALLMAQMKDDELIIEDGSGNLIILPRGRDLMQKGGDRKLKDKGISILWDPIAEQPVFGRPTLVSDYNRDSFPLRVRFPSILKTPTLGNIDISTVQSYRRFLNDIEVEDDREDILRLVSVRRVIHRYREATVLLYENGRYPIAKIAIDNLVDESLSSAFAQKDGINFLGVDAAFSRKAGAIAVDERLKRLAVKSDGGNLRTISQQRGVLRLKIDAWKARLDEEHSDQVVEQLRNGLCELKIIDDSLNDVPVRPLNAPEMNICLIDAFTNAKKSIVITTTIPNDIRFPAAISRLMEQTLQRNVSITVYIADRPSDEQVKNGKGSKSPLSRLNDLAQTNSKLQVSFLRQMPRPVFEILWDDTELAFSNDSPLGLRPDPSMPRLFKGFRVSNNVIAGNYVARNMSFSDDELVKQVRSPKKAAPNPPRKNHSHSGKSARDVK